ncbi:MAG: hypothetical protein JWQ23_1473 [Herminiimonas sp.]|nr:hypothetical protein [Herminiimonas sp.]
MTNPASTILIVDDEIHNRRLLEALLQPEGYRTLTAVNGEDALAATASHQPDLIVLDVMMPGMNGYEVAKLLKASASTASIPIIMVTALDDRGARLAGLDAGVEDFLTKPVDRAELWLRVRNLLRLKSLNDLLQSQSWMLEQKVQARTADLQRFRTAMDFTADSIFLVSRSTMRFVEVNATACKMHGYTRDELLKLGPEHLSTLSRQQLENIYDATIERPGTNDMAESRLKRNDGSIFPVEMHRQALPSDNDWIMVCVIRDITERREVERRLKQLAHYDSLTGLPNRLLFFETLKKSLLQASDGAWKIAVMFIDLDNFKNVNDTFGHAIGDELLVQVSNRLAQCIRIRDTVGRLGGDEFALILNMQDGQQGVIAVANKIHKALAMPFDLNGHEMVITASIGITVHPEDASDPETLIKYADTAMYRAKQAGRNTFRFFTAQMNIDAVARHELETALRKAINNNEFVLHYQPKVFVNTGRIAGLEALLRWQRPGHGLIAPDLFMPALEETGLIVRVGSWVIATACQQIGEWMRSPIGPVQISVNVSGRQFIEGNLEDDVSEELVRNGIPAELLELELTEGSLMENTERTISTLEGLTNRGVQISIDDFGTGYSSLAYLRRFPINKLKIDIAFIRNITTNPDDAAIALTIIRMAHSLKLAVIAEGVETAEQLAYLRHHRCDQIQGYLFSRPLPATEVEQMLRDGKSLPMPPPEKAFPFFGDSLICRSTFVVPGDSSTFEHLVHIYEDDATLMEMLELYILTGLLAGEAAIVIATKAHLAELEEQLTADGVDLNAARAHDQYIPLVADETLERFMKDGMPDDELFASVMLPVLARARRNGRRVRGFGEMVALTWAQGNKEGTAHLETLWNRLCNKQMLTIFCAYPRAGFTVDPAESIAHVCSMHSRVIEV